MAERCVFLPFMALAFDFLAGCEVDESVVLEASIESPALTVQASTLTTEVTGSFDMTLSLGQYGSDPTTVKLGTFSLKRGDQVLLDPLYLDTVPEFPVTVGVGKTKHVDVSLMGPPGSPPELAASLCDGELQIAGTLTDSLTDDRPRPVTSQRFQPDCPP